VRIIELREEVRSEYTIQIRKQPIWKCRNILARQVEGFKPPATVYQLQSHAKVKHMPSLLRRFHFALREMTASAMLNQAPGSQLNFLLKNPLMLQKLVADI
jgi:hypothetical protein